MGVHLLEQRDELIVVGLQRRAPQPGVGVQRGLEHRRALLAPAEAHQGDGLDDAQIPLGGPLVWADDGVGPGGLLLG